MRFVGNILFLLTGGIVLSFGWLCAGLIFWLLVVTRPLAGTCLQLAGLCLWPAGRAVVRDTQLELFRSYIRSGSRPAPRKPGLREGLMRGIQALAWLPVGILLMCGHFLHAGLMVFPIFTNNWARQQMGLAAVALFPFGARVTTEGHARIARRAAHSAWIGAPGRGWTALAQPFTALSAAVLILWVPSDNQARAPAASALPSQDFRPGLLDDPPLPFTNFDLGSGRLQAGPPLNAGQASTSVPPLAVDDCARSPAQVVWGRLSRGMSAMGVQPLGSQLASNASSSQIEKARQVANIERWVGDASIWQAKAPAHALCRSAVLKRIAKASPMPISRKAIAARAVIERTGKGALHAQARSMGPLKLHPDLLLSAAKQPEVAATFTDAAPPALTLQ